MNVKMQKIDFYWWKKSSGWKYVRIGISEFAKKKSIFGWLNSIVDSNKKFQKAKKSKSLKINNK